MGKTQDTYLTPPCLPPWPLPVNVSMEIMVGTIMTNKLFIRFFTREDNRDGEC